MAIEDIIDARIAEALKDYQVGIKQLPIYALRDRLNQDGSADGDTALLPHSVGPDALAVMPTAKLVASGAQAVPNNAQTQLTLATVAHDTASMTTLNTNAITAPVDGIYLLTGLVEFAPNAGGFQRQFYLLKNGATRIDEFNVPPNGGFRQVQKVATVLSLTRGDYVGAYVFQDSGGALNTDLTTASPNLSMTFLSNYLTQA